MALQKYKLSLVGMMLSAINEGEESAHACEASKPKAGSKAYARETTAPCVVATEFDQIALVLHVKIKSAWLPSHIDLVPLFPCQSKKRQRWKTSSISEMPAA